MKADWLAIEGTPFPKVVKVAKIPKKAKIEIVCPVEVRIYTLKGGKIKKVVTTGEIKESYEVEGAVEPTPYMIEQWKAGKGGFPAIYSFLGKPLSH